MMNAVSSPIGRLPVAARAIPQATTTANDT